MLDKKKILLYCRDVNKKKGIKMTKSKRKIKYISKNKNRLFENMTEVYNNFMNYANNFVENQKKKKGK